MKTVCIYHSIDLDGWMSAAIIKHCWQQENYICVCDDSDCIINPGASGFRLDNDKFLKIIEKKL